MRQLPLYHIFDGVIPAKVCDVIVEEGDAMEAARGTVGRESGYTVDTELRDASVAFWDVWHWVNGLMTHYAAMANREYWQLEVEVSQGVQYGCYGEGEFYGWHRDSADDDHDTVDPGSEQGLTRVVSSTLSLSDPESYEGGLLMISDAEGNPYELSPARRQGSVVVFPSHLFHQVTPITRGVRKSCVSWILGRRPSPS